MNKWYIGDYAIARIAKKTFAKVRITKCEDGTRDDGTYFGDKVLGIQQKRVLGRQKKRVLGIRQKRVEFKFIETQCYFVQICRTGEKLWVPATELQLAERARPYYGQERQARVFAPRPTKKEKIKEEITVSLIVDKVIDVVNPDINTSYEHQHNPATQRPKAGGTFSQFVKRQLTLMHMLPESMEDSNNHLSNSHNDLPTELKYLKHNLLSVKEHCVSDGDNSEYKKNYTQYLYNCWQFKHKMNRLARQVSEPEQEVRSSSNEVKESAEMQMYYVEQLYTGPALPWCLVCTKGEELQKCIRCPASFHRHCTEQWFNIMMHRKNLPSNIYDIMFALTESLSSTRSLQVVQNNMDGSDLCPGCRYGPSVGYGDIVWQKLRSCAWWPARILSPGSLPPCLISNRIQGDEWPVLYYGTMNYAWCSQNSVVLFLPQHGDDLLNDDVDDKDRRDAIMDACEDYISVYLS